MVVIICAKYGKNISRTESEWVSKRASEQWVGEGGKEGSELTNLFNDKIQYNFCDFINLISVQTHDNWNQMIQDCFLSKGSHGYASSTMNFYEVKC